MTSSDLFPSTLGTLSLPRQIPDGDLIALLKTFFCMVVFVESIKYLSKFQILSSTDARKIMHIGCGPIFLLCWPLYNSSDTISGLLASMAPLSITFVFGLVGLGYIKDESTINSMSRSGKRQELLKGPLAYGLSISLITILYWRNLSSLIPIICLCGGDGFADIIGRRFGKGNTIPWSPRKSFAGSFGFILGCSTLILSY